MQQHQSHFHYLTLASLLLVSILLHGYRQLQSQLIKLDCSNDVVTHEASIPVNATHLSNQLRQSGMENDIMKKKDNIDFIVAGFPKCATSAMNKNILQTQEEIEMLIKTRTRKDGTRGQIEYFLRNEKDVEELFEHVSKTRSNTANGLELKIGIKWPTAINGNEIRFLTYMRKLNPNGKDPNIIVGMRHPVRWFESFYNHRYRSNETIPPLSSLSDPSMFDDLSYFTKMGRFERGLVQLGKVDLSTLDLKIMSEDQRLIVPTSSKVFLYLQEQLEDEESKQKMYADLRIFLGLKKPIEEDLTKDHKHDLKVILDICEPEYKELRHVFLKSGSVTAAWIRDKLVQGRDVVIGGKEDFLRITESWGVDPCL